MSTPPRLIGDVGGTHVRLALASADDEIVWRATEQGDDHPSLPEAIRAALVPLAEDMAPEDAVLAVAGPVTDTHFRLTNRPDWEYEVDALRQAIGVRRLTILNDFTALALSIPRLGEGDSEPLGPPDLKVVETAPIAVLGPGTGLGVSALVWCGRGWQPISGEGGHVFLAARNDLEVKVLKRVRRFGIQPSASYLLSGPGLRLIYAAIAGIEPDKAPDASAIASADNSFARETLALFASWLGAFAGDMGLIFGARGGVYIGGGVVPKLGQAFDVDRFRASFEDKGQVADYAAKIPTRLITRSDAGVLGALAASGMEGPGIVTVAG